MRGLPGFGEVLARWVARGLPEAGIDLLDVAGGAALPGVAEFDAYVVSGSEHGVYDDTPWMTPLRGFLDAARSARRPLVGICFGHQIMADTFGGKAEKVGPPEVGVRHFRTAQGTDPAHVWHQDQVTRVPPGAEVIAVADYCPVAGLSYDFPAVSVQFHPEYEAAFIAGFLRQGRGAVLDAAAVDAALAEIARHDVAPDLFAAEAGEMVRRALAG